MSARDELASIIRYFTDKESDGRQKLSYHQIADKIIFLPSLDMNAPSGMVKVNVCPWCAGNKRIGNSYDIRDCEVCNGTGTITSDLTNREAIEMMKSIVEHTSGKGLPIAFSDGRVQMKEEK